MDEPLIDKLYRRLRAYRTRLLETKLRWRAREAFLAHRSTADNERCNEVMEELARLRVDHQALMDEEVRQRRRAITAMEVNAVWIAAYQRCRDAVTAASSMDQLVDDWGRAASLGKKLEAIRVTDDDMVAPGLLTDHAGLLPGWRPDAFRGMSPRAQATWRAAHEGREMAYWRPEEKLDWNDPMGTGKSSTTATGDEL